MYVFSSFSEKMQSLSLLDHLWGNGDLNQPTTSVEIETEKETFRRESFRRIRRQDLETTHTKEEALYRGTFGKLKDDWITTSSSSVADHDGDAQINDESSKQQQKKVLSVEERILQEAAEEELARQRKKSFWPALQRFDPSASASPAEVVAAAHEKKKKKEQEEKKKKEEKGLFPSLISGTSSFLHALCYVCSFLSFLLILTNVILLLYADLFCYFVSV